MSLKDYNYIQSEIIKSYRLECMIFTDSINFFKMCSELSTYRDLEPKISTICEMLDIVERYEISR